jgi:hypothetical protein
MKSNFCCVILTCILGVMLAVGIPVLTFKYINENNYKESECYIDKITLPQNYPTFTDSDYWLSCDCGRNCNALSPCVTLYTNNTMIKTTYDSESECTFHNESCPTGEDPREITFMLNEALYIYNNNINTTISCYSDGNNYILYKDSEYNSLIIYCIIFGIFFLICLCNITSTRNKNDSNTYNQENPEFTSP